MEHPVWKWKLPRVSQVLFYIATALHIVNCLRFLCNCKDLGRIRGEQTRNKGEKRCPVDTYVWRNKLHNHKNNKIVKEAREAEAKLFQLLVGLVKANINS